MSDGAVMVTGIDTAKSRLRAVGAKAPSKVAAALYVEAELISTASQRLTPVDTGALRASHNVRRPTIKGGNVEVRIEVGGPSAGYAIFVHESTKTVHKSGEDHFLQKALDQAAKGLGKRVANRIKL